MKEVEGLLPISALSRARSTPASSMADSGPLYRRPIGRRLAPTTDLSLHEPFSAGRMERLWSLAVATSGNRWQMGPGQNPQNHAETVAVGCDQLPTGSHGKEGVDGSSPSEGSAKAAQTAGFFCRGDLHELQCAGGMEPFMELSGPERGRGSLPAAPVSHRVDEALTELSSVKGGPSCSLVRPRPTTEI
jgi:hypothetical protein